MLNLSQNTPHFLKSKVLGKPRTFGVYLGSVSYERTADEERVLKQWEMILVNPFRPGVTDALLQNRPPYVVGRVDIRAISEDSEDTVGVIADAVIRNMRPVDGISPYNGVLIANWEKSIPPEICNELAKFFSTLNLNVYVEVVGPEFTVPPTTHLSGMIFCNGSI